MNYTRLRSTLVSFTLIIAAFSLLASIVGCDLSEATVPPTTGTPTVAASIAPPATSTPGAASSVVATTRTPAACTAPQLAGELPLMQLPGVVRAPSDVAWLDGKLFVSGRLSENIGVVQNNHLTNVIPIGDRPSRLFADSALGRVFALSDAGTLTMLDGTHVLATIPVTNPQSTSTYQSPDNMLGDAQNHRLYIGITAHIGEVAIVDLQTFMVTSFMSLGSPYSVGPLALDAASNTLYVKQYDHIGVYDLTSRKLKQSYALPGYSYSVLAFDPTTGRLYADVYQDNHNWVTVLKDGAVLNNLPVGADPDTALIVGRELYVSNSYSSTVSILDLTTSQTLATVNLGSTPGAMIADASGEHVYVTINGYYGPATSRIDVIDTRTRQWTASVPLSAMVQQLLADPVRHRLYALVPSANALFVMDSSRVLARVPMQRAPYQMALDDKTGRLFIADPLSGDVSIVAVERAALAAQQHVAVPWQLRAVAVDEARSRLIANNRLFALGDLSATGQFSLTGYIIPFGEGIAPDRLLVNPSIPRVYAVASNGVPGSNGGTILYVLDAETMKQQSTSMDRNVTAIVLDDDAQRLYSTTTHPMASTTKLTVLDALRLSLINTLGLPTRVTSIALNPATHHLFMSYFGYASLQPAYRTASDDVVDILDTRTLGRVLTLTVPTEPSAMAYLDGQVFVASNTRNSLSIIRDCAAPVPPAPTNTPTPTAYPTVPPASTFTPTPTPRPAATPTTRATVSAANASPTPPCRIAVAQWLQAWLASDISLRDALGCPSGQASAVSLALQEFTRGRMLWRADSRTIYVLLGDHTWSSFADTWDANQPEGGTETPPAEGLIAPKRGFGKIWREKLGGPNAAIGWATGDERGVAAQFQDFESGVAFGGDEPLPILMSGGKWR